MGKNAILGMFAAFAGPALLQMNSAYQRNKAKLEEIQKEYNRINELPRKLKERRKRELQLDWNLYQWEKETLYTGFDLLF